MKILFLSIFSFLFFCCAGLDLPSDIGPSTVSNVACNALYEQDCFGAIMDTVGIRHDTCSQDIQSAVSGNLSLNIPAASDLPAVCRRYVNDISDYVTQLQKAAK
jgi:hypothetical protein